MWIDIDRELRNTSPGHYGITAYLNDDIVTQLSYISTYPHSVEYFPMK